MFMLKLLLKLILFPVMLAVTLIQWVGIFLMGFSSGIPGGSQHGGLAYTGDCFRRVHRPPYWGVDCGTDSYIKRRFERFHQSLNNTGQEPGKGKISQ